MKFSINYFLLGLISILFLFTRLYRIGEIPPSVYWDEASIGYNAYSILQTGKDEWGEVFPLHFRAFGEFKLPVYVYATVVSVFFFGLNEFSVRLPSVLFSLGTVLLTYLLGKRLFGKSEIGLLGSFFLVISPWFFIFSRTGYEVTAGVMFYLLGVLFFLQRLKGKFIFLSILSFILSAYSYNSFRLIVPVTVLTLVVFNLAELRSTFKKNIIYYFLAAIVSFLALIPIYRLYVFDNGGSRLSAVSAPVASYLKNYTSHFSPNFLFFLGDKNLRSQQAGFGQLYLPDMVFLALGLWSIILTKGKPGNYLVILLLLLSPIPGALTRESPHALRALSAVPFIAMISAAGVFRTLDLFKHKAVLILITVVIIYLVFFFNYFAAFINNYSYLTSKEWQLDYKKIYVENASQLVKYNRIIISDKFAQPYIFALFYLTYDPEEFRKEVMRNNIGEWGFSTVKKFGKFEFVKSSELFVLEN